MGAEEEGPHALLLSRRFPFLLEDEETKLVLLFGNHVSLGQREPARAAILQLSTLNKERALEALASAARGMCKLPRHAAKMCLFCAELYAELGGGECAFGPLPSWILHRLRFDALCGEIGERMREMKGKKATVDWGEFVAALLVLRSYHHARWAPPCAPVEEEQPEESTDAEAEPELPMHVRMALQGMEEMGYSCGSVSLGDNDSKGEEEGDDSVGREESLASTQTFSVVPVAPAVAAVELLYKLKPRLGLALTDLLLKREEGGTVVHMDAEAEVIEENDRVLRQTLATCLLAAVRGKELQRSCSLLQRADLLLGGDASYLRDTLTVLVAWVREDERLPVATAVKLSSRDAGKVRSEVRRALALCPSTAVLQLLSAVEKTMLSEAVEARSRGSAEERPFPHSLPDEFLVLTEELEPSPGVRMFSPIRPVTGEAEETEMDDRADSEVTATRFWSELFYAVTSKEVHVLEYILDLSLQFIRKERFEELAVILQQVPLLRPLLPLLGETALSNSPDARRSLLSLCYDRGEQSTDPLFADYCCYQQHALDLASWFASRMEEAGAAEGEGGRFEVIDSFCAVLEQGSIVAALKPCLWTVRLEEVEHLLLPDAQDRPPTAKHKRMHLLELMSFNVVSDLYEAMRNCYLLCPPKDSHLQEMVNRARRLLNSSDNDCFKVAVMEKLFNILFLTSEDVGDQPKRCAFDSGERHDGSVVWFGTEAVVEAELAFLQELLANLPLEDLSDSFKARALALQRAVKEGRWRVTVLQQLIARNSVEIKGECDYMAKLCISQNDFLLLCLRSLNFSLAKEVVAFFSMGEEFSREIRRVERFQVAKTVIQSQAYLEGAEEGLSTLPSDEGLLPTALLDMVTDLSGAAAAKTIAAVMATTAVPSRAVPGFINLAAEKLEALSEEERQEAPLPLLISFFDDCKTLGEELALSTLLSGIGHPIHSAKDSPAKRHARVAHWNLFKTVSVFSETLELDTEAAEQLCSELSNISSEESTRWFPLVRLTSYLLQISTVLVGDSREKGLTLGQCWSSPPAATLRTLIFNAVTFGQAEQFATISQQSLMSCALEALDAKDTPQSLSLEVAQLLSSNDRLVGLLLLLFHGPDIASEQALFLQAAQEESNGSGHPLLARLVAWRLFEAQLRQLSSSGKASVSPEALKSFTWLDSPPDIAREGGSSSAGLQTISSVAVAAAVRKLSDTDSILAAVALADAHVEGGASDDLLKRLLNRQDGKAPDEEAGLIARISDKIFAAEATFSGLQRWGIDTALELLAMLEAETSLPRPLAQQVKSVAYELRLYKEILSASAKEAPSVGSEEKQVWQKLAARCRQEPLVVITELTSLGEFKLARKVASLFAVPDAQEKIEEDQLIAVLKKELSPSGSSSSLAQYLEQLPKPVATAEAVLARFAASSSSADESAIEQDLKLQLYLTRFVLQKASTSSAEDLVSFTQDGLGQRELGLRALLVLPPELRLPLYSLAGAPAAIVENVLMAERTVDVGKLLKELPALSDDQMMLSYAAKAVRMVLQNSGGSSGAEGTHARRLSIDADAFEVRLTGGLDDEKERSSFRFFSTPNVSLYRAIVALCSDVRGACEATVTTAAGLCTRLFSRKDPFLVSKVTKELLFLARDLYQVAASREAALGDPLGPAIDRLIGHLELLQSLVTARCQVRVTLEDLSDKRKAEALRDQLVREDHMQLAMRVCTSCGIDSQPVWSAWGLSLLAIGEYNLAKEKLTNCLVERTVESYHDEKRQETTRRARSKSSAGRLSDVYSSSNSSLSVQEKLVAEIVGVLEEELVEDNKALRTKLMGFLRNKRTARTTHPFALPAAGAAPGGQGSAEGRARGKKGIRGGDSGTAATAGDGPAGELAGKELDPAVYMQCVFYLTRYGGPEVQVAFFLRHNLLEDAVRCILRYKLPPAIFVRDVAVPQLRAANGWSRLQAVLKKTDKGLVKFREHLLGLCSYLSKRSGSLLLEVQLFMGDYVRAGLTYISQSKHTPVTLKTIELLEAARKSLSLGLEAQGSDAIESPLTESETEERLNAVKLQLQVTQFFYSVINQNLPPQLQSLNLFGDRESKGAIVEQALVWGNFDLAFRITQQYRLDTMELYTAAITRLAKGKRITNIQELLESFRSTLPEDDMDEIVMVVIKTLHTEVGDPKLAEKFVNKLSTMEGRVRANLECGKAKAAYLLAVQARERALVKVVLQHAALHGPKSVVTMCNTWLAKTQQ